MTLIDRGLSRAILVCSTACLFCAYQFMLQGATAVMVPELIEGLDLADIGLLTSSFLYVYLLFQLPGGLCGALVSRALVLCHEWFGGYMLVFSQVKKIGQPRSMGVALAGANACMLLTGLVLQPTASHLQG